MIPRPALKVPPAWSFPLPGVTSLETGLNLWTYDLPGQCILSCHLVIELPINAEPVDRDGIATLAIRTLDEGSLAYPGPQYGAALDEIGARFGGHVGLSTTQCLMSLPYDSFEAGMNLLAEAVQNPGFAPDDVARIKANRMAEIEQQESLGSYVASTELRSIVIDPSLRLAHPAGGSLNTISTVTPTDVTSFHARYYQAKSATLIIAGDLNDVDAQEMAMKAFGNWQPNQLIVPEVARPGSVGNKLINRNGAVQADIRFGWYGIDRRDPRWASLQVALTIMAGSFGSRLNRVLREERGFTYAVSMNAHPFRTGGMIDLATATRTSTTSDLIEETLGILQVNQPFTDEEVRDGIGYLTMSAPLTFDTAEAVASQAAGLAAARLDLDHVSTSLTELAKVTPDSAMEAFQSLVTTEKASIVVVGDTDEIDVEFES